MEKEEKKINEDEKQNAEEEEFDEEEEEEKEDNEKKKEKKDINEDNKKESNEQGKVDKDKDKEIEGQQIEQTVEEKDLKSSDKKEKEEKDEKEQNSVKKEEISTKIEEKIENINKNEKEISETEKKQNEIKDNANTNNNEVKNKIEIKNENEENNEEKNNKIEKIEEEENEMEEKDEELKDTISTYILKYTRKNNEPRESSYDKELIKSKYCLFMIEFKILQGKKEKFLLIYCHEIAAIYFDEIYEKKYSLNDLYKENRHFRIFDDIEEAKKVIDEILNNNNSNSKKIFIDLKDNIFRLHLNITFFDKENEVIFSIPKKHINDKERIRLLPEFLKEIQIKMNHLEEDNKRLKNENKNMTEGDNLNSGGKVNINKDGENDFLGTKNEVSQNIKKIKSGNMKGYKKKSIKK